LIIIGHIEFVLGLNDCLGIAFHFHVLIGLMDGIYFKDAFD